MAFQGYVKLTNTLVGALLVTDSSSTPIQADALPTFRIYSADGFIKDGTCAQMLSKTITAATNATPIVITATDHGLTTGAYVTVAGVLGNTAANGDFVITKVNSNQFSLDSSVGNGAYTSGGSVVVTGLYSFTVIAQGVDGYEAGEMYHAHFEYLISSVNTAQLHSFQVN